METRNYSVGARICRTRPSLPVRDKLGNPMGAARRDFSGCASQELVQAVESPERDFLLGVQWHPELLLLIRRQRRLFHALVEAARSKRASCG